MIVYVETNFLLELALEQEQHASCEGLLQLAEAKAITLAMPAFSVTEAVAKLKRTYDERFELQKRLNDQRRELSRTLGFMKVDDDAFTAVAIALIRSAQAAEPRFAQLERRLFQTVRLLPLDAAVASEVSRYSRDYKLKPPDATILASVMKDPHSGQGPSCFLNSNTKDFGQAFIIDLLKQRDCKLIGSFDGGLSHVQNALKSARP